MPVVTGGVVVYIRRGARPNREGHYNVPISNCPGCEEKHIPPVRICPECGTDGREAKSSAVVREKRINKELG